MTTLDAIILDTETTTNKDTPERPLEVIELAWIPLSPGNDLSGGFARRYKPKLQATFGATAVHHILPSDLEDCPPSAQAPQDVPPAKYWIGHNIDFDWKALGSPSGVKRICTLALSRSLWPECDAHNLSAMMYFTQGCKPEVRERLRSAHAATDDCEFVLTILQTIMAIAKTRDLAGLHELSEEARIPKTMQFGKFKGEPISAVDRGYASWYARQEDVDPYVIVAFKRQGLLR